MLRFKNTLLLSTVGLSMLHTLFHGMKTKVDIYLFIDYSRRIDYAIMNLTTSVNFLILSYCLMYPKGISIDTKRFILIICILDLIHYITVSKVYFGTVKIIFAVILFYLYRYLKNDIKRIIGYIKSKWQN